MKTKDVKKQWLYLPQPVEFKVPEEFDWIDVQQLPIIPQSTTGAQ